MSDLLPVHLRWLRRAPDDWAAIPVGYSAAGGQAWKQLTAWKLLEFRERNEEHQWRRTSFGRVALDPSPADIIKEAARG